MHMQPISIHLFDDDFNSEDEVYESSIEIAEVNGTVKAEETIEVKNSSVGRI